MYGWTKRSTWSWTGHGETADGQVLERVYTMNKEEKPNRTTAGQNGVAPVKMGRRQNGVGPNQLQDNYG